MVIDEAHRLKNKDSALAADLRQLSVEHMHLLSGTPLQNNTTELWALLFFLDPHLFPSLDAFLSEFGTLTDATQARPDRRPSPVPTHRCHLWWRSCGCPVALLAASLICPLTATDGH